jgi:hypothetical protein
MNDPTLPLDGWLLDPDAARPPFEWQVSLPTGPAWSLLDTYPASWQRSAERLNDSHLAGRHLRTTERKSVLAFLGELVGACQLAGTVLSLVQIGALDQRTLSTVGLHIAWYDSAPDPSSLATVRSAASTSGVIEEIDTPAGPVILQRDYRSVAPSSSERRVGVTSLQAFLPVPGHTWTAIVATSSPHPEVVDSLRVIVIAVAGSIRPTESPEAFDPEDGADLPLVQHRVGPDAARSRPQP